MELTATIEALKQIKNKSKIKIYTDSKYDDGINIWIKKWKLNNWKTSAKKEVKMTNYGKSEIHFLLVIQ